jgi:DNA-binding response OmpR family regulator
MPEKTSRRTVLLVDDDVMVRNLIRRSLEQAGFAVLSAADAEEAFALSRARIEPIDALVADVELPGRDGIALAEQLARERKDLAVLVMSAGTEQFIPEPIAFISKPFPPADLIARLADMLGLSRHEYSSLRQGRSGKRQDAP